MRFLVTRLQWEESRIKLKIKTVRTKKNLGSGFVVEHHKLRMYPNLEYPRFHIESRKTTGDKRLIDIHIDWVRHLKASNSHILLEILSLAIMGDKKYVEAFDRDSFRSSNSNNTG